MKDNLNKIWHKHDGKGMPIFLQNEQFEVQLADGSLKKNHRQGWDWYKKSCDNVIPLERDLVISWRYIVAEDYVRQAGENGFKVTSESFAIDGLGVYGKDWDIRSAMNKDDNLNKYQKVIYGKDENGNVVKCIVDVYDVLEAWKTTNPALQHLIKKALQPGERGHKSLVEDLKDIIVSAQRALEIEQSKEVLK